MRLFRVRGGRSLSGEISVSGSKNAALPIIFSCILINGVSEIRNLPDIGDTRVALEILGDMGAGVSRFGEVTYIDTRSLYYSRPNPTLVSRIRASTYLLGACLGRFGICHIGSFGGCNFSDRPIDMHIAACSALGCRVGEDRVQGRPRGAVISFDKPSVGATVNALLLSVTAEGKTRITGVAREPHIDCLVNFLISAGADIRRTERGFDVVGRELHSGRVTVIDDMIEAGSYFALGLGTGERIKLRNCPVDEMGSCLTTFRNIERAYSEVVAEPYPAFPTDLQPIAAPLMAKYYGGKIIDRVWKNRFGYLDKLASFGVKSSAIENHAEIFPSELHSAEVTSPDLRGGFACLMCALMADGESIINSADTILRGYENLVNKLRAIGAEIYIENS